MVATTLLATVIGIPASVIGLRGAGRNSEPSVAPVVAPASRASQAALRSALADLCSARRTGAATFSDAYTKATIDRDRLLAAWISDQRGFVDSLRALHPAPAQVPALRAAVATETQYGRLLSSIHDGSRAGADVRTKIALATAALAEANVSYRAVGAQPCVSPERDDLVALQVVADLAALPGDHIARREFADAALAWAQCLRYPTGSQGALSHKQVETVIDSLAAASRRDPTRRATFVIRDPRRADESVAGAMTQRDFVLLTIRYYRICRDQPMASRLLRKAALADPVGHLAPPRATPHGHDDLSEEVRWIATRFALEDDIDRAVAASSALDRAMKRRENPTHEGGHAAFVWTRLSLIATSECEALTTHAALGECRRFVRALSAAAIAARAQSTVLSGDDNEHDDVSAAYNRQVAAYNDALRRLDEDGATTLQEAKELKRRTRDTQ